MDSERGIEIASFANRIGAERTRVGKDGITDVVATCRL